MDYYLDIQVKPDTEMRENVLLNKLYTKLHKVLFDINSTDIGVSFPNYKVTLGHTLRLHATENRLVELQKSNWIGGLSGYCQINPIQVIPALVSYRTVSRIQSTMSQAKLKRLIKRSTITEDQIKGYKAKMFQKGLDNPYLELESTSNSHKHRRYIAFSKTTDTKINGCFDSFGLSKLATIPWF
jgi:CRISPR-associated endonuclease Csy4